MRIGLIASTIVHVMFLAWVFGGLAWVAKPEQTEAIPVELVQAETAKQPEKKPAELALPKLSSEASSGSPAHGQSASAGSEADKVQASADKAGGVADAAAKKAGEATASTDQPQAAGQAPQPEGQKPGEATAAPAGLPREVLEAAPSIGGVPALSPAEVAVLVNGGIGKDDDPGGVVTSSLAGGLSDEQIAAVRAQAQRCWVAPNGWSGRRHASVTIRFRLKPDGSVDGTPVTIEGPASPLGKAAADKAVVAVQRCGPYQLPPESYDKWRVMELHMVLGG